MTDEQTQKITPGKYVEITYNLYTLDGDKATLVHQVDVEDPERRRHVRYLGGSCHRLTPRARGGGRRGTRRGAP